MLRLMRPPSLLLALFFLAVGFLDSWGSPIVREPGAIYFSDLDLKPLPRKVLRPAACFFDLSMTRYAGTLRFPQIVKVEAVTDTACRIRGNAQQGGVAAWVPFSELEPFPEGLLADLKKADKRRQIVNDLIARNEVALGMTVAEVGRSLGRPQKKSKRADKEGTRQVWEFIKYALVPQTTYAPGTSQTIIQTPGGGGHPGGGHFGGGHPGGVIVQSQSGIFASTIYVKVPVGTLTVSFKDDLVESIDQSEGTLVGAGQVSIVTPPISVYW